MRMDKTNQILIWLIEWRFWIKWNLRENHSKIQSVDRLILIIVHWILWATIESNRVQKLLLANVISHRPQPIFVWKSSFFYNWTTNSTNFLRFKNWPIQMSTYAIFSSSVLLFYVIKTECMTLLCKNSKQWVSMTKLSGYSLLITTIR